MPVGSALNTSHQTVGWFLDQSTRGKLTLRPPFQRRPVWTREECSFLIDTILRGYPVPEIYVYASLGTDGDGGDSYAVIDGQQRLIACLEYMDDQYPISFDTHKLEPLYTLSDTPWFNKTFTQLEGVHRDLIRRYKLIVRTLEDVADDELRHMFQRLNQSNMALNAQELRFSMYSGGMLGLVEMLVKRREWDHFRIFTKLQQRRMLDSEYVAELVIGYLHWPQNKKDNIDHYYRLYSPDFPQEGRVVERFDQILRYLSVLFPEPRMAGTRWYRKSDFYTLFLALARGRINIETIPVERIRTRLVELSGLVALPLLDNEEDSPVSVYRRAVERAATDRARRVRREDALVSFIAELTSVPATAVEFLTADEAADDDDTDELDEEYVDATDE